MGCCQKVRRRRIATTREPPLPAPSAVSTIVSPAAGKHFEQALALNPAYSGAHTFYAFYLSSLGRSEEALAVPTRALDRDPASSAVSHSLAVQLYLARQFEQAIELAHNTLEMDAHFAISYEVLGETYLSKGMYREGLLALEQFSALNRSSATSRALLGYAQVDYASTARRYESLRSFGRLRSRGLYQLSSLRWFMPGSMTRIKPSVGSKRLIRSGSIVSLTSKSSRAGTVFAPIPGSSTFFGVSASHRKLI
jgi:tetratricopeptide (TPR) repeat protein